MARTSLQVAVDAADSLAQTMAFTVTVRRCSWVQFSGLPHKVQQSTQDFPFEGFSLFSGQKDTRHH